MLLSINQIIQFAAHSPLIFSRTFNTNKATISAQLLLTKFEGANKILIKRRQQQRRRRRRRRRRTMRCLKKHTADKHSHWNAPTSNWSSKSSVHLFEEAKLVDTMNGEEKIRDLIAKHFIADDRLNNIKKSTKITKFAVCVRKPRKGERYWKAICALWKLKTTTQGMPPH